MQNAPTSKLSINVDDNEQGLTHFTTFSQEFSKIAQGYIDRVLVYYSDAHKENLKFDNPAEYIWNKYKNTKSEYFRSDLTELERAWSYDVEIDMLSGLTRLQMNNPFVFGDDIPTLSQVVIQANKESRLQIEFAINNLFEEKGIQDDISIRLAVNANDYKISVSGINDEELTKNIEQILNSGNNGKNLYEHIKLCNPAIFGFDEPNQYKQNTLSIDYISGHLSDIDTKYGYGEEQTGWENLVKDDKCDFTSIKNTMDILYIRFLGTYNPQTAVKNLDDEVISLKPSAKMSEEKIDQIGANIRLSMPFIREQIKQKQYETKLDSYRAIDPDGSIFRREYFTAYITKLQEAVEHIENYYSKAHNENSKYKGADGLIYLWNKYKDIASYNLGIEREMAYKQEKALYLGGKVTLGDKYALASFGGLINSSDLDKFARQVAYNYLNNMINKDNCIRV